jgi:membrane protease YdiL (CAAX protease family)
MKRITTDTQHSFFDRLLKHPLVRLVLGLVFLSLGTMAAKFVLVDRMGLGELLGSTVVVCSGILSYILFVRLIEKRPVSELALTRAIPHTLYGLLIGWLLMSSAVAVLYWQGFYQITAYNGLHAMAGSLMVGLVPAFLEEIIFRAIIFRLLQEWLGSWGALLVSGLLFGLVHIANPGATLWSSLAIGLEAGVLLGAAYMLTRTLWLAIGIHFAWNFSQSGLYGLPTSGIQTTGLVTAQMSGPEILTGGSFGIESSILAVVFCLGAAVIMLWRAPKHPSAHPVP